MEQNLYVGIFTSLIYSLLVLGILQYILFQKSSSKIYWTYFLYVSLATIYYFLNLSLVPDFKGFTGGFRVGTDDCRFFSQIVDVSYRLPNHCYALTQKHSFSIFIDLLFPFEVYHPLQIIIFNVIGITLIPFLGEKIYFYFFENEKTKRRLIFYILLLSPSILANGLIIMREGWIVQFFLVFIYCILYCKSKIILLVSFLLLVFLRPSFIVFPVLFYLINKYYGRKYFYLRILLPMMVIIPLMSYVLYISDNINVLENLTRDSYVDSFLTKFEDESIYYKIWQYPFPLNVILSFIFFYFSPFLSFNFYHNNIFLIRNVFSLVESIIMIVLIPVSTVRIFKNWYQTNNRKIFLFVSFSILVLSTLSLQFRHKIIVIPLLYILFLHNFDYKKGYFLLIPIYFILQVIIIT